LAFVKRIAEKHGGSVTVASRPGETCFEIHLPTHAVVATGTVTA
jgi:signal transduction histidine kinase